MREMLKSWFNYFIFISFFGMFINLIYLVVPVFMMVVYDRVLFSFSTATLWTLGVMTLFSLMVMGLLDYLRSKMLVQAGIDLEKKMYPRVLSTMNANAAQVSAPRYDRGMQDLMLVRDALAEGSLFRLLDLPWMVVYLALLFFIHPLVGIIATAGVAMTGIFLGLLRVLNRTRSTASDSIAAAGAGFLSATLRNAELVKAMGMLSDVQAKYERTHEQIQGMSFEAYSSRCGIGAIVRTLQATFTAGLFGTGSWLFFKDEISVGMIFASVMIICRLFSPLELNLATIRSSALALAAYKRLKHFVAQEEQDRSLSLPTPEGRLQAEGLTLALNKRTVLVNISFLLEPGESLGILGPQAAGKTSLLKLLLGIWSAASGKTRLDGAEITQWKREELGAHIGYLPQETELFQGSVAENIARLKKPDSEKVLIAAAKAHCHEMILKLPGGYDFMIDSTGKNLSGGQRQQIALARALYNDPAVVVLDEPHLCLDDLGFRSLFMALAQLKQEKKTVVMVTDRPNLLVNTDKILMLKDGQTAMFGPSGEVLAKLTQAQQPQAPQQQNPPLQQVKQN